MCSFKRITCVFVFVSVLLEIASQYSRLGSSFSRWMEKQKLVEQTLTHGTDTN